MQVRERQRFDEGSRLLELFFGFTGKPTITSAPMAASGIELARETHAMLVMLRTIPPMHPAQYGV